MPSTLPAPHQMALSGSWLVYSLGRGLIHGKEMGRALAWEGAGPLGSGLGSGTDSAVRSPFTKPQSSQPRNGYVEH